MCRIKKQRIIFIILIVTILIMGCSTNTISRDDESLNSDTDFIIRYSSDFEGIQIIDEQNEVLGIMMELLNGSETSFDDSIDESILKFWIENPTGTVRMNYEVWGLSGKLVIKNKNTGRMVKIYKMNSDYLYRLFELD